MNISVRWIWSNNSPSTSPRPASIPAADCMKERGRRWVILSTAILLAYSPTCAPPIPSLTAKMKSAASVDASPVFPSRRTSRASSCRQRKLSSLFLRTLPRCVCPNHWRRWPGLSIWLGEDRGELEIDEAEAAVALAVGHIAHFGIVVPHAVRFKLGEKLPRPLLVQVVDPAAAIGRDDAELLRVGLEQARHKVATARFEMPQHARLGLEPFLRLGAAEGLDDLPVVRDAHRRPQRILNL